MPATVSTIPFSRRKASHVHPRLLQSLVDNKFFPTTVTFQVQTDDRTPSGGFVENATWEDVPGLIDIPCRRGVPQSSERQANERTTDWGRVDIESFVIVLDGHYPAVTAAMRAVMADGQIIDLRGVNTDSDLKTTTATGRTVVPGSEAIHT